MNQCDVVQLLKEAVYRPSGELQINHNGVTWNIGVGGGQLRYAYHSLHRLDIIEQFLQSLGLEFALPAYRGIVQEWPDRPMIDAVAQLRDRQILSDEPLQQLLRALAEDALECLLWNNQGQAQWQDWLTAPGSLQHTNIELNGFIQQLEQRRHTWIRFEPTLTSPYQCPRCDDFGRLQQPIAQGILPVQTLEMMARLMQGVSLRQLAFLLKQDVMKLCQMLHPYIVAGVLRLESPIAPYHLLPTIPARAAAVPSYPRDTYTRDNYPRDTYTRDTYTNTTASQPIQRYKVVCIDDSPTVLETIQRYLGTEKFDVATVENPMASLSALFDMKPDLILMDVSMPGIDGNRLCQILKRSSVFTNVPIVMVSGNTGVLDKEKAKAAGATDYLTKPFSKEELLALVDQYLRPTSLSQTTADIR
jgi:two-component system, chemotaxis family, response regulator PixG